MKRLMGITATVLMLCAGCTSKIPDSEVAAVLTDNVPAALKAAATVGPAQTDISSAGDDSLIKFKTQLQLAQPLFESVDFAAMARSTQSDTSLFEKIEGSVQGLVPTARNELAAEIEKATQRPAFIVQTAPAGTASDWYGSFKAKKVVDKWVSSDFKTEAEPKLKGQPRAAFPEGAIEQPNAKAWFSENQARQVAVLQKIEAGLALAQKDIEIAEAKASAAQTLAQKDSEVAEARAAAAAERQAREMFTTAVQKQVRQMPVNLTMRPALVGGTLVLGMQAAQAMSVRLEVERGLQHFARDYQLVPGRTTQVGHMEGWGFKSGDTIRVSNPSFDTKAITVR
jgi:hypothetical protein